MSVAWRPEDGLDEEGRPFELPDPRPWNAQDYLIVAAVLLMALVCLALARGWLR